jgi:hypothetical protein
MIDIPVCKYKHKGEKSQIKYKKHLESPQIGIFSASWKIFV